MVDYAELLKDPLWKNKRRRIVYRDGGKCTVCGSKKILQVHHTFYYQQPTKPWDYPDESLITVCKVCHEDYHKHFENVYKDKPKTGVVKKKRKPRRAVRSKKKKGQHRYNTYKPCLATSQALRLGYRKDNLGHWIKTRHIPGE